MHFLLCVYTIYTFLIVMKNLLIKKMMTLK
jgi:hypothetical protein